MTPPNPPPQPRDNADRCQTPEKRESIWWFVAALALLSFGSYSFGYSEGRDKDRSALVRAVVQESVTLCQAANIVMLRNTTRLMDAKNRQVELRMQEQSHER